ncbi:MAG TPA: glycosyltransferase family 39 protein [Vicinamibacteria bacterium]|nr:glycosyltransferase family 39 protein [Vicinamibacteria bacterium]
MKRSTAVLYAVAVLLAVGLYLHDLGSPHIPKNGDEYLYIQITRLTAAGGSFLPLRSEIPGMRNTKPPLLFWQGIVSTDWGRSPGLWRLRSPSVAYTFLTGLLVFLLGRRLGDTETGLVALLAYLAFFSTYRYGRPFLTNAPEVFWLFVPFFALLHWRPASFASRFAFPAAMGLALGLGLLYKSFALVVPVGLALALWYAHAREWRLGEVLEKDLAKVVVTLGISLAIFSTWFLLDPDPRAVWDEFVVGENVGKFDRAGSYLRGLVGGRFSLPSLAAGFLLNAGLLVLPFGALLVSSWRRRGELREDERLLWIWVVTLFIVYCLPSQRSSRYLLPAMPAVAVLLALYWPRMRTGVLAATLVLAALPLVAIIGLSLALQDALAGPPLFGPVHWSLLACSGIVLLLAVLVPSLTRPGVLVGVLLVLLSFSSLLRPLDGPLGRYDARAQRAVAGRDVWVPVDFVAKEEGYRLLLPGARVNGYPEEPGASIRDLLARYPLVAVRLRAAAPVGGEASILGERLDLRGRQRGHEIREMLAGDVSTHLFVREVLIERPRAGTARPPALEERAP